MKMFKSSRAYLILTVILCVIASGSLALAGSHHEKKSHHVKPAKDLPTASTTDILGSAAQFGVFGGGAGMTNQGILTIVNGDIGTTGVSTLVTGFHDSNAVFTETTMNIGQVNGTVHTATAPAGSVPNVIAAAAALDAQTAFDNLSPAALPGGIDVSAFGGGAGELGNRTLAPGVYQSAPGSFAIQGGDLTLDARGDKKAVWVFQMATTLTVGGPGAAFPQSVILVNGAQAKNVFWQVGSAATINAAGGGTMAGTIIASSGAAFSTAGNVVPVILEGRVLALHASVTLVNTQINVPAVK
ncbi:ice-binding family protein [Geopsychrobacter electrodiphilus]|uniref:ice-binding family protein n=1 Tax=Geopsychrobacter electrodiphilus TaxID=225196 RepID=UPI00039C4733|nr:ice-binding family protein [Geopsychrobacter electrodiphilus]